MQTKKDIDKLCKHLQKSTTLFWEFPIAQITQGMECPVISCDNKTAFRKVKGKCVNKVPKCRTSFSERTFYCCEKCGALFMLEQDFIQMKEKERNNQFHPFTVNGCRNPQDIVHRATRCHFSDKFTPPSKEFFISMQYEEKPSSLCLTDDYYRFLYPESDEEGFELKEALTSSGASKYFRYLYILYLQVIHLLADKARKIPISPEKLADTVSQILSLFATNLVFSNNDFSILCAQICDSLLEEHYITSLYRFRKAVEALFRFILTQKYYPSFYEYRKKNYPLYFLLESNGEKQEIIVVNSKKEEEYPLKIHYSNPLILQLIAQICIQQWYSSDAIPIEDDVNKQSIIYSSPRFEQLTEKLVPKTLIIKKNGGYYDVSKNPNYEIVDILLFSPYEKRMIPIAATYDKEYDECFIDVQLYLKFVKKYGDPKVIVETFEGLHKNTSSNHERDEQSFYKVFGYNVSQNDDLSETTRQALLMLIMDLELRTPSGIVSFLIDCIRMHPNAKYAEARRKWNCDKEFVENYKVNPTRFVIPPQIKR